MRSFVLAFITIIPFVLIALTQPKDFKADIIQNLDGKQTQGKLYVKGSKYLIDTIEKGEKVTFLVNRETGKTFFVNHSEKTAREISNTSSQSLSKNPFESAFYAMEHYNSQEQGLDTINGIQCKKIQVYDEKDKKLMKIWKAEKLNWLLKIKTQIEPIRQVELKNIEEESLNIDLFKLPAEYKILSLPMGKKKIETNTKDSATSPQRNSIVKVKPVSPQEIESMKEAIFEKLERNNIKKETKDGQIKLESVTKPILQKFFPKWKIFHVTREKQIQEEISSSYIPVEKAAVNKDDKSVCIISSPATDMPLKTALTIVKSEEIKLKNTEEFKEFANALDAIYFKDSKIQGIDSLGNNKWAIYTGTYFEYLTGFLVKVDSAGEVSEIKYSLKIKKK